MGNNAVVGELSKSAGLACGPNAAAGITCPGQCDPHCDPTDVDLDDRNAWDDYKQTPYSLARTPASASTACCYSVGSTRGAKAEGYLRNYFCGAYLDGMDPEEIRGYTLERIDTGTHVWTHAESGISVWTEVVNVAADDYGQEPRQLLFHYCSKAAFVHVTNENRKDAELFAALVDVDGLFGAGVYTSMGEPADFGRRRAVVENKFTNETTKDTSWADNSNWSERAAFCIPVIAPLQSCFDVRVQATPEMVYGKARDKHGVHLQPGRDLWVVRIKDEDRGACNAAANYDAVLRRRLARHEGLGARERAVQDIVSLGRHLRRRGRHQEALIFFEKALQINLAIHGASHPSVATSYNEMAVVYHRHCQYAQALDYYEKTMKIQLATLGKAHPHVASTYNNIAVVYGRQGDHAKALEYYEKAHAIKMETLGDDHPSVAATFHNMANIYRRQHEYQKALEYYDKALKIRLSCLGDTHPSVGDTYYNMGMLYRWMYRPGETKYQGDALKAFRAAYKAYHETYGPDNQESRDAKQQVQVEEASFGVPPNGNGGGGSIDPEVILAGDRHTGSQADIGGGQSGWNDEQVILPPPSAGPSISRESQ